MSTRTVICLLLLVSITAGCAPRRDASRPAVGPRSSAKRGGIRASVRATASPQVRATDTAQATFEALRVDFFAWNSQEVSIPPGGEINIHFGIKNMGPKPVSGLRVALRPSGYLTCSCSNSALERIQRNKLRELTTTGLPIFACEYDVSSSPAHIERNQLNPYGSRYYRQERGMWNSHIAAYVRPTSYGPEVSCMGLRLSPVLQPGRDIALLGYVVVGGRRFPVGRITVHVMHPSDTP